MTVIRPNSISGITSITAQANEINVFRHNGVLAGLQLNGVNHHTSAGVSTFHTVNILGNLDVAGVLTYQDVTNVDSLGIGTFRTGINVSGGQLDVGSNIKLGNAGVITATSFVGNGANLSGVTALTGSTNNTLVTVTGANAITGEATLTYDGNTLQNLQSSNSSNLTLKATSNSFNSLILDSNRSADTQFAILDGRWNGTPVTRIQYVTGSDGSNKDDGYMAFHTRESGQSLAERLRITTTGQILIGAGAVATPKVTQAGSLDLDSGGISLCIGGNENSNGRTNSTNKLNRIVTPHYTNAEEPMAMISGYSTSGASELFYGGGSGLTNAATSHHFYTASGTTTTTGTKRLFIRANGQIIVGEANVNPVSDFEVRRANAGGDVSIRIGNNTSQDSGSTASLYFTTSPSQNFNTSYIQAKRDGGKLDFGYATNSPTVTMHVSNSNVGVNNTTPEGVGIDILSSRTNAFSATADQRNLAHLIVRNASDGPGRFSSLSFVNGGGTQAEGSINLVQTGNYTGDMTFKMRNGSGSNDWVQAARFLSDGDFDFNKFEPDGTITTTLSSNSSSGNYTTIIPLNTSGIGHLHVYLVSIHWSFNSNGSVPYYCSGAVLWQTPHSNASNGVNHPITMLSSCHVGGNYHLQIRNITHSSSYPGLQAANMNWTAIAGSHYIVKYKRIY